MAPIAERLVCKRCGHGSDPDRPWISVIKGRPRACPDCHSRAWDREPNPDEINPDTGRPYPGRPRK